MSAKVRLGDYIQEYSVRNKGNENIPVFSVTNTQGFCQDYFGKEVASKDKSTYKIVPRGYFAYNPSRINVGSIDWQRNENRVIVSPLYNVFAVSPQLNQQYLYYYLKSDYALQRIRTVARGSVRDNLKFEMLCEFPIYLPDLSKQKEIVWILDQAKRIISLRTSQIQLLDNLIKARFVEMFGDPATNPIHWDETTVGKECCYIKDGPHKSLPDIGKENGGHPFISVRNIVNHVIDFTTARYISDEDYKEARKKCCPEKGDMLYSKGGTTGIAKLIDVDIEFANWVHLAVLKFDKEKLNGLFFENMLNCDYCYDQSQKLTKGIANRDLVLSAMAQIKMYRPPKSLQDEFATFVQQVDKSKIVVQKALDKAQLLFDGLMQKYFG
ncbi:MAG: restriction endonuclease subunit S [Clostridia bacterium]|nr:restriction endonuclease subunit S [Clostridia bacterium]